MSTISLSVEDEDLKLLKEFSSEQGQPLESWLSQQLHYIALKVGKQRQLHPDAEKVTGIFQSETAWREDLIRKHE